MDKQKFKTIMNEVLLKNGLKKSNKLYTYSSDEVVAVIGLQKSNYANGYYINVGFIIKTLSQNDKLRDVDGDVRARITIKKSEEETDFFDLDYLTDDHEFLVESTISSYIQEILIPSSNIIGLKNLLEIKPKYLYQTTLKAKQVLGFL